jgi:NAD(P)H-flavin reductase
VKQCLSCRVIQNTPINDEIFRLDFTWAGTAPRAGQFFMIKPKRSSVFLGRPISLALWNQAGTVQFLIAQRGRGTEELASMQCGEEAELIGPLGNAWADFLPAHVTASGQSCGNNLQDTKPIALIGGGVGLAPLNALLAETSHYQCVLYAGFRTGFKNREEKAALLGLAFTKDNLIIATEDGTAGHKGRIPDFLNPADHSAVCACGPEAMLQTVVKKCAAAGVPCYVSLERNMACGAGACLGCTVATAKGNRRCCADGPVFPAKEVFF